MHILLTDRLTCPRCGPEFGVILLAHHIQDRRILEGELGCANCRERFHIARGVADLRWPPQGDRRDADIEAAQEAAAEGMVDPEPALGLAAQLGITSGPGYALLAGDAWVWARGLANMLPDIEWVTDAAGADHLEERDGVSRVVAMPDRLPFFSGTFRGVVCERADVPALTEAARLLAPGARLVLRGPAVEVRERLNALDLEVVAADSAAVVATRPRAGRDVASTSGRG